MNLKGQIDPNKLPKHVAIIMDGNGRWAKKNNKPRVYGHQQGVESVRTVTETASNLGIEYVTLYAFSTENWSRPDTEVNALMELLVRTLRKEIKSLNENNVIVRVIGDVASLPGNCREELNDAIKLTENNTGLNLVLALSYSGRWDMMQACKKIAGEVKNGKLEHESIDESTISEFLSTSTMPDPELLIRTSAEFRISNFLLWQLAYAELYFTDKLWPEFDSEEFYRAIIDYQHRERRFGKISEQIKI